MQLHINTERQLLYVAISCTASDDISRSPHYCVVFYLGNQTEIGPVLWAKLWNTHMFFSQNEMSMHPARLCWSNYNNLTYDQNINTSPNSHLTFALSNLKIQQLWLHLRSIYPAKFMQIISWKFKIWSKDHNLTDRHAHREADKAKKKISIWL